MKFEGIIAKGKVPTLISKSRKSYVSHDLEEIVDVISQTNELINKSFREKNTKNVLFYILSNLSLIEPYIEYLFKIEGEFTPVSIPAIEKGLIFFPIHRYLAQVKLIDDIIDTFEELYYYKKEVSKCYGRLKIAEYIHSQPNMEINLNSLKQKLKVDDQLIIESCSFLEQFNLIRQTKRNDSVFIQKSTVLYPFS